MKQSLSLRDAGLLTKQEVANRLDVSTRTVENLVKTGKLVPLRQGQRWIRFRAAEVDAYIRSILNGQATDNKPYV